MEQQKTTTIAMHFVVAEVNTHNRGI